MPIFQMENEKTIYCFLISYWFLIPNDRNIPLTNSISELKHTFIQQMYFVNNATCNHSHIKLFIVFDNARYTNKANQCMEGVSHIIENLRHPLFSYFHAQEAWLEIKNNNIYCNQKYPLSSNIFTPFPSPVHMQHTDTH